MQSGVVAAVITMTVNVKNTKLNATHNLVSSLLLLQCGVRSAILKHMSHEQFRLPLSVPAGQATEAIRH